MGWLIRSLTSSIGKKFVMALTGICLKKKLPGEKKVYFILFLGYFANLLPFIFIGRTTFLYHYLPALTFGIILAAYWLNHFLPKFKGVFTSIFILIILNFLILLPHSLGLTF